MSQGQSQVLYGLYSVVEHSGRLNSGHYVAYVRSRPLDPNHTNRQYLNLKPSSQFEIDHLVAEMAERVEASSGTLHNDLKASSRNNTTSVQVCWEFVVEGKVDGGRPQKGRVWPWRQCGWESDQMKSHIYIWMHCFMEFFLSSIVQDFEEEIKAGRWFHVSDTYVAEVNIDRVLKAQAYLLFYERLV